MFGTPAMIRLVLAGMLLVMTGCATSQSGFHWPTPPLQRAPSSERPAWLPVVPDRPERYREPDGWYRGRIAEVMGAWTARALV
jgi:hypothetical protein